MMSWFKVDDKLHSSQKLLRIPRKYRLAALGLWTLSGSWSADQLTDGKIPDYMVEEWGATKTLVEWLVKVDLWIPTDEGTAFKNWSEYQPTKADVEKDRAKNREKLRKWRERNQDTNSDVTGLQASYEPDSNAAPDPTRPDPSLVKRTSSPDKPETFDEFWQAYPRKVGKGAAVKAYKTALKKTTPEQIMSGLETLRIQVAGKEQDFIPHASSWLNAERWEDETPTLAVVNSPWSKDFHK